MQAAVVGFARTGSSTGPSSSTISSSTTITCAVASPVASSVTPSTSSGRSASGHLEVTANGHAREFYESVGFVLDHMVDTRFAPGYRMRLDLGRDRG